MSSLPSPFKSPRGEKLFMAVYEAGMRQWNVPYATRDIPSRFGSTRVAMAGPEDAAPLVLLHGLYAGVGMWANNIADLARDYRVYALDVMGQPGKSIPDEPIRTREDYVEWLNACWDALGLADAHLAGESFGGWLAVNYALAAPERIRKLILLSPAGTLLNVGMPFMFRGMLIAFLPGRFWGKSFMRWATYKDRRGDENIRRMSDGMAEMMYLGMKHFKITPVLNPVKYSDAELQSLSNPVLLLLGRQEVLYSAKKAVARAKKLIPSVRAEIIHRASHDMLFSQANLVDQKILQFLKD